MTPGSSSDGAIRGFAPACLREPYLRMVGGAHLSDRAVSYALAFVEASLRYLTALLAPEGSARKRPPELEALWSALAGPSLGHWLRAADGLAREVLGQPEAIARPAALALRTEEGRPTPACRAFEGWITARNGWAHDPHSPLDLTREEVLDWHASYGREFLAQIVQSFDFVREIPLFVIDQGGSGGRLLRRFQGSDEQHQVLADPVSVFPDDVLIVGAQGRAFALGPLLVRTANHPTSPPWLLHSRGKKGRDASFLNPDGGDSATRPWHSRWDEAPRPLVLDPGAVAAFDRRANGLVGTTVAGHTVAFLIERGATSVVYAATGADHRPIALKVLHPAFRHCHRQHDRQVREVEILQRLEHPGIVRVLDLVDDPEHGPVIVMERAPGADLGRTFSGGRARLRDGLRVIEKVLDALDYLHSRRIVHRDVKPANIVLDGDGVKLVDFGIARDELASPLTRTLDRLGTPAFAAPEQASGQPVGPAADLYAVGRLVAWLLTGTQDPKEALGKLTPGLAGFVRRATRERPDERFSSARAMLAALRSCDVDFGPPLEAGDVVHGLYRLTCPPVRLTDSIWSALAEDAYDPARLWLAPSRHADACRLKDLVGRQAAGRKASFEWEGLYVAAYAPDVLIDGLPRPPGDVDAPEPPAEPGQPRTPESAGERASSRAALPAEPVAEPPRAEAAAEPRPGEPAHRSSPAAEHTEPQESAEPDYTDLGFQLALGLDRAASPTQHVVRFASLPAILSPSGPFGGPRAPDAPMAVDVLPRVLAADLLLLRMAVTRAVLGSLGPAAWFAELASGPPVWDHRVDHEEQLAAVVELLHRVPNEPATAARLALAVQARRPAGPARRQLAGFTAGVLAGLPARALHPLLHRSEQGHWQILVDARPVDGALALVPIGQPCALPPQLQPTLQTAWLDTHLRALTGFVHSSGDLTLRWVHDRQNKSIAAASLGPDITGSANEHPAALAARSEMLARGVRILGLTDGRWWRWLRRIGTSFEDVDQPEAVVSDVIAAQDRARQASAGKREKM